MARAVQKSDPAAGDGSAEITEILAAVGRYAQRRGEELTADEMRAVLTAVDGLDGASAEGYQALVYQLYEADPVVFAQTALHHLPEPQKNTVLDFFRYEWTYQQEAYKDFMDRAGIIEILEQELTSRGLPLQPMET